MIYELPHGGRSIFPTTNKHVAEVVVVTIIIIIITSNQIKKAWGRLVEVHGRLKGIVRVIC